MFSKLRDDARALSSDQRGLTTVEYVIVLCLIAAVGVTAWQTFGSRVNEWIGGADRKIGTEMEKSGGQEPAAESSE
jgi:Flp pilus assembly pilin Flp